MIEFIKKLDIDETSKNALIGAFNEEKVKFDNDIKSLTDNFKNEKDTLKESLNKYKDYEDIKAKVSEYEASSLKDKADIEALKQRADSENINFAIEKELLKSNAKHTDLLMNAVNKDNIKFENGKITGIDEALTGLKENYSDLFNSNNLKGNDPARKTKSPEVFNADNMSAQDLANNWDKFMQSKRR